MNREGEEAFFTVLSNTDLWKEFKKYMYTSKKVSNFYDYRDGDLAVKYQYFGLIRESTSLHFTFGSFSEIMALAKYKTDDKQLLDILLFIHAKISENPIIDDLARCGWEDVIRYLLHHIPDKRIKYTTAAIDSACEQGYIKITKLLHYSGFNCTTLAIDNAALYGHLDIIKFLHRYRNEDCTIRALSNAAKNNHLQTVRFLCTNFRNSCNIQEALRCAKERHNKNIVRYLLTLETPTYDFPE